MNAHSGEFTLTSVEGRFVFPGGTIMSHAKLVRDTLVAGRRGAIPHVSRPRPENAMRWLKDNVAGPVPNNIRFEWILP